MSAAPSKESQLGQLPEGSVVAPAKEANLPTTDEPSGIVGPPVMQVPNPLKDIGAVTSHTEFPTLTVEGAGAIQVLDKQLTPEQIAGFRGSDESAVWRRMRLAANKRLHR